MCFETTKSARAKIAEKDIICWKWVNTNLTNAFSRYLKNHLSVKSVKYKENIKMPKVVLRKTPNKAWYGYVINRGYHSFIERPLPKNKEYWELDNKKKTIVKSFIIPKGTKYYKNKTEYVSETIMLVE